MQKVKVIEIRSEKTLERGTVYKVLAEADGVQEVGDIFFKPEIGKEYELERKETDYGTKWTKPKQGAGGFSGKENPEKQASIERQNSMTNAVNRNVALANTYIEMAKLEADPATKDKLLVKATEKLEVGHQIIVAAQFFRYNAGELNIGNVSKDGQVERIREIESADS